MGNIGGVPHVPVSAPLSPSGLRLDHGRMAYGLMCSPRLTL